MKRELTVTFGDKMWVGMHKLSFTGKKEGENFFEKQNIAPQNAFCFPFRAPHRAVELNKKKVNKINACTLYFHHFPFSSRLKKPNSFFKPFFM